MISPPFLLLASNSPRRKELMGWTRLAFDVKPADVDESVHPGEKPEAYVTRLALLKAETAVRRDPERLILAADTTVADGDDILGKPVDAADARRMLLQLRGHTHFVHTALVLVHGSHGARVTELCSTPVEMREYTEEEIDRYIQTGDPLDKAGAYAIQHAGFHPVKQMTGCYACVIGLPLCHLVRALRKSGFDAPSHVAETCQANLGYDCPVTRQILADIQ